MQQEAATQNAEQSQSSAQNPSPLIFSTQRENLNLASVLVKDVIGIIGEYLSPSKKEVAEFLRLVAEGEQEKAEVMLKRDPLLALAPGDVTDLSGRTFTGITAFQYAVWALDWHMWTMIRKYLPMEEARFQAQNFETGSWVEQYGVHANLRTDGNPGNLDNLIQAYQSTIDLYQREKYTEGDRAWVKKVGQAQRLLPAHFLNEYCHPVRSFYPVPNFKDASVLPRSRTINNNKESDCFTTSCCGGELGEKFAISRGDSAGAQGSNTSRNHSVLDFKSIFELVSTRTAQRKELITELNEKQSEEEVEHENTTEAKNSFVNRSDKLYWYSAEDIHAVIRQYRKLSIFQDAEILDVISNYGGGNPTISLNAAKQSGKVIFGIFNMENTHWTAYCIVPDMRGQAVMLYKDSKGKKPPAAFVKSVIKTFRGLIQIKFHKGAEQDDETSWGIFALENLRLIACKLNSIDKNNFIDNFENARSFCNQGMADGLRKEEFAEMRVLSQYEFDPGSLGSLYSSLRVQDNTTEQKVIQDVLSRANVQSLSSFQQVGASLSSTPLVSSHETPVVVPGFSASKNPTILTQYYIAKKTSIVENYTGNIGSQKFQKHLETKVENERRCEVSHEFRSGPKTQETFPPACQSARSLSLSPANSPQSALPSAPPAPFTQENADKQEGAESLGYVVVDSETPAIRIRQENADQSARSLSPSLANSPQTASSAASPALFTQENADRQEDAEGYVVVDFKPSATRPRS